MKVLVTGGAGYIGSTICSALEDNGYTPVILDNLSCGRREFTIGKIFYEGDIGDVDLVERIFFENPDIICTIHCAALIVVPDSVARPFEYYQENISKSLLFFKKIINLGYPKLIFSSSASIYDDSENYMVYEDSPLNPRSPYARTKYMLELIIKDFAVAYNFKSLILRYFNPIGADPNYRSGPYIESPSHLLGKMITAYKNNEIFKITGVNWDTRDGTGIRDYIHVWDLALAHVQAVKHIDDILNSADKNYEIINIGNGQGSTVREMLNAFNSVVDKPLVVEETEARPGDVAGAFTNSKKAKRLLSWETKYSIGEAISSAIKWDEIWKAKIRI
jgi:UDP-glucose 4-epimerase